MTISDLALWDTFVHVADQRSFARAGRILSMGAPAVTKRISLLEEQLRIRLFNRTTRVVTLTPEAENLLPMARQLIDSAGELEQRAKDSREPSGLIRLTCLPVVAFRWLAPVMVKFKEAHPKVDFELDLSERIVDLVTERMDLAIRVQPPKGADFVYRELADNELVICASPKYLQKAKRIRKPADLRDHPLLTLDLYSNCRFLDSGTPLRDFENARSIRCEVGLFQTELALLGAGIAIRSKWDIFPFLESGELVQILQPYRLEPFGKAYLVIPQRRYLSFRVRAFVDHLMGNAAKLRSMTT